MDRAVADFKQVMQTSPELAMHAALWRYFVHVRIGVGADAVRILAGNTAGLDRTHWPTPIVDGIIDGSDVAAVVNAAKNSRGSQALPMCDIDFYMGEHALVNGRLAEARPLLRKASTGCSIGSISRHAAAAELKRVGGAK
jgi:lipoprotein NlpI